MDIEKLHKIFLASEGISTDTRVIKKNQLFFALKGENFDGNKYAGLAIEKGAAYAIVDNLAVVKGNKYILVNDVLLSLQQLATFHRKYLNIQYWALLGPMEKQQPKS
jgi:UDP-N-acetylmuramoyl-tripeptide--D-alanyl-D-alanine ligase